MVSSKRERRFSGKKNSFLDRQKANSQTLIEKQKERQEEKHERVRSNVGVHMQIVDRSQIVADKAYASISRLKCAVEVIRGGRILLLLIA